MYEWIKMINNIRVVFTFLTSKFIILNILNCWAYSRHFIGILKLITTNGQSSCSLKIFHLHYGILIHILWSRVIQNILPNQVRYQFWQKSPICVLQKWDILCRSVKFKIRSCSVFHYLFVSYLNYIFCMSGNKIIKMSSE